MGKNIVKISRLGKARERQLSSVVSACLRMLRRKRKPAMKVLLVAGLAWVRHLAFSSTYRFACARFLSLRNAPDPGISLAHEGAQTKGIFFEARVFHGQAAPVGGALRAEDMDATHRRQLPEQRRVVLLRSGDPDAVVGRIGIFLEPRDAQKKIAGVNGMGAEHGAGMGP